MKFRIYSDLHLEFASFTPPSGDFDAVILAGDIFIKGRGLEWAKESFPDRSVIYVMGNHEYYGKAYPKHLTELVKSAEGSNIHILDNKDITIDNIKFLGCTLWTDFEMFGDPRIAGYHCQGIMNDFKKIRLSPKYSRLRTIDAAMMHKKSLRWLESELIESAAEKTVVVTHHAPSKQSLPGHRLEKLDSAAYASNLDEFVKQYSPNLWVHGHIHHSCDYHIGNTRIICNPRGYPDEPNEKFDPCLEISI